MPVSARGHLQTLDAFRKGLFLIHITSSVAQVALLQELCSNIRTIQIVPILQRHLLQIVSSYREEKKGKSEETDKLLPALKQSDPYLHLLLQ